MTIIVQLTSPQRDYVWLKAAVADWMHRKDLTGRAEDFIALAESRIKAKLWSRYQDKAQQIQTVGGVEFVTLPEDLVSIRSLTIPDVRPKIDYVSPDQFNSQYSAMQSGDPQVYTIIGGQAWLAPTPDKEYTIWCMYRASFPALTDLAPSNLLLVKWPDLYLWGALSEACTYSRNAEFQTVCEGKFRETIDSINNVEWSVTGSLAVRTDVRTV